MQYRMETSELVTLLTMTDDEAGVAIKAIAGYVVYGVRTDCPGMSAFVDMMYDRIDAQREADHGA